MGVVRCERLFEAARACLPGLSSGGRWWVDGYVGDPARGGGGSARSPPGHRTGVVVQSVELTGVEEERPARLDPELLHLAEIEDVVAPVVMPPRGARHGGQAVSQPGRAAVSVGAPRHL